MERGGAGRGGTVQGGVEQCEGEKIAGVYRIGQGIVERLGEAWRSKKGLGLALQWLMHRRLGQVRRGSG